MRAIACNCLVNRAAHLWWPRNQLKFSQSDQPTKAVSSKTSTVIRKIITDNLLKERAYFTTFSDLSYIYGITVGKEHAHISYSTKQLAAQTQSGKFPLYYKD